MNKKKLDEILKKHKDWLADVAGGIRANLDGANLNGANLNGANLSWASLDGASLRWANLNGANLSGANLSGASLDGASLDGANLSGANLSLASLDGASLDGANLSWANLDGAVTDKQYLIVSCIGSRKDSTTYCVNDDFIWCGCFTGTLAEFEAHVHETYPDGKYRTEYDAAIAFFRAVAGIRGEQ